MIEQGKACRMVDSLSYLEAKHFRDFLASPYFNRDEQLSHLFDLLRHRAGAPALEIDRHIPDGPRPSIIIREDIHRELYGNAAFDDLHIRRSLSALLRMLLDFLETEVSREDAVGRNLRLLEALRRKSTPKIYEYEFRRARALLDDLSGADSLSLLRKHQLEAEYHQFLEEKKERSATPNLEVAAHSLDKFYLAHKLRYLCAMLNYEQILGIEMASGLETELVAHLMTQPYPEEPSINIYFTIYRMLKNPEDASIYESLTGFLTEYGGLYPVPEARDLYAYAQNYCIRYINQGETRFLKELFALYEELLEKEILLEKNYLSPWDYKNITVVALRLEAFDWAEKFITTYKEKLEPKFRENAYTYNLAKLQFYRQKYSQVLKLLQEVDYEDVFYALDSRVMLLKTYFELDEIEALFSLVDSFRVFLRRNKLISDRHRKNYLNLIKFTKKLSKVRPSEKKKIEKIRSDIESSGHVADINWLRQKLDDLA